MFDKLKNELPNIPEEVIRSWLLPFAENDGLPSSPDNEWDIRKTGETLSFWNDSKWEKITININQATYSRNHNRAIGSLIDAYVKNVNNSYYQYLGQDGKNRFLKCLHYILKNGVFPVAPIVMITHKNQYEVLDGNHRFAAYKSVNQAHLELESLPINERKPMLENLGNKPKDFQEIWVCRPKWENSPRVTLQKQLFEKGIDIDAID